MNSKLPRVSMIATIGRNRELGKGNKLIWRIPSDLKRFRELTSGHPVIMGRKTYESIGHPLPNRTNIIVTHDPNYKVEGVIVVNSIEKALRQAQGKQIEGNEEIFIIGGAQIYALGMPYADRLCLTRIDAEDKTADAFFPDYPEFKKVVYREKKEEGGLRFEYLDLEKA